MSVGGSDYDLNSVVSYLNTAGFEHFLSSNQPN